jgi:hypothetical protein
MRKIHRSRGRARAAWRCALPTYHRADVRPRDPAVFVTIDTSELVAVALGLAEQAERAAFRGPDPYDGLWWGWPRPLVAGRRRRQALIQAHARCPFDMRRLYRRDPSRIAKTLGVFGSVGVRAARLAGAAPPLELGLRAVDLLDSDRMAGPRAWGYHWDMQTRWSFYPAGSPNVVVTTFAASGLLEGAALMDRADFAERARGAARWVAEELWIEPEGYFGYHPARPVNIHNANLLGAWLVHVTLADEPEASARVRRALTRTLDAQRPDGSFPYGETGGLEWADSFHTGYVLTCLARLADVDPRVGDALARGAARYERFFDARGRAQLWASKPYPEDAHSAGTGLTTLAALVRLGVADRALLERVAVRLLDAGIRGGHAVHRRHRRWRTTVQYLRWCDAHVALGLVDAAAALRGVPDLASAGAPTART